MSYLLEPYKSPSTRHTCPSCGAKRQFAKYIHSDTREYLADNVGRCNREQNCAYHYTPKQYFHDHPENNNSFPSVKFHPAQFHPEPCHPERSRRGILSGSLRNNRSPQNIHSDSSLPHCQIATLSNCHIVTLSNPPPQSHIPDSIFQHSLIKHTRNHFITFLSTLFDPATVTHLVNTYYIGTSKHWPGSTVFWQLDIQGNIRDGKIMLYDPDTGHRVKHPFNHITWAHSALKLNDYNLHQCFFGEHLLNLHPALPVSIVESEKTAIIASIYFPQFIWLATGGKNGCKWSSSTVSRILQGRHITLWPDIQAYDDWSIKARELTSLGIHVTISNLLEQMATPSDRSAGLDIADYLIRFKPSDFIDILSSFQATATSPSYPIAPSPSPISPLYHQPPLASHPSPFSGEGMGVRSEKQFTNSSWPLDDIESFFSSIQLPPPPLRLDQCSIIHNLPLFISGHLSVLRTYNGKPHFLPYLHRLQKLQQLLASTSI